MEPVIAVVFFLILCFLVLPVLRTAYANTRVRFLRSLVTGLVGLMMCFALMLTVLFLAEGSQPLSIQVVDVFPTSGVHLGILYDGVTSLMLLLVSFVGFVVCRFSIRYLDGEALQGRYYQWLGFTIGAVSLMVVAGNLLLFFVAWVMTSVGLHQLLLHYRHRPAAHRAAWTKFAISRLGDLFLITALVLTFRVFGTFDFQELFAEANLLSSTSQLSTSQLLIPWLLMLGAVTKSAQFPFHVWLPNTMETPTPVSALMHAGIVNAGGYLVIRMSPLFTFAPASLLTLSVIGTFTACFAGVVMMTQPSVKRGLAYSTIAQMGFMMLQCGLGAYSAAMLHIIAHSLYKAHAFLSSGSVMAQPKATTRAVQPIPSSTTKMRAILAAIVVALIGYEVALLTLGINLLSKPGGLVLSFILLLALTSWSWQLLVIRNRKMALIGLAGVVGLCLTYIAGYAFVDHFLQSKTSVVELGPISIIVFAGIMMAFTALLFFHAVLSRRTSPAWLTTLRTHALNGFYIDNLYHRLFGSFVKS